jgi:hypothetical protein
MLYHSARTFKLEVGVGGYIASVLNKSGACYGSMPIVVALITCDSNGSEKMASG